MKEELQKKLKNKHQELFEMLYFDEDDMPEEYLDEESNARPMLAIELFGIECGDGWYDLIDTLCDTIENYFHSNKDEIPKVHQVKEKFGGLRFYTGGIHEDYADKVWGAISMSERMSYKICETCGTTEDVIVDESGWIKTKCKKCRDRD